MPTLGLPTAILLVSPSLTGSSLKLFRSAPPVYSRRCILPIRTGGSHQAPAYLVAWRLFHGLKLQSFGIGTGSVARYWYSGLACCFQSSPPLQVSEVSFDWSQTFCCGVICTQVKELAFCRKTQNHPPYYFSILQGISQMSVVHSKTKNSYLVLHARDYSAWCLGNSQFSVPILIFNSLYNLVNLARKDKIWSSRASYSETWTTGYELACATFLSCVLIAW